MYIPPEGASIGGGWSTSSDILDAWVSGLMYLGRYLTISSRTSMITWST